MRGKRASDDLAKSIYRFKDANIDYANSAIARIFSISESTLRGILKRHIRRSDRKKSNWVENLYSREESSVSFWAALIETRNSGFLTFKEVLLTARRLVSKATSHRFLKNRGIRNRVAVQDVLKNAQKDTRVNWCRRYLFDDFTNLFPATKLLFPFDLVRNSEEFTFTEKLVKNFYPDLLPAHPKLYSEDPSQYGTACRIGISVAWKRLLVPWIANTM